MILHFSSLKKFIGCLLLVAGLVSASSCARDVDESQREIQERILKAFMNTYYPGVTPTGSGLYILDSTAGSGKTVKDSSYILLDFSIRSLEGSFVSFSSEEIAKQLGTYRKSTYYGPQVWDVLGAYPGVKELLIGMQEGGRKKAVMPSWLLNGKPGDVVGNSSKIYDLTVEKVIDDIEKYEMDLLKQFSEKHFSGEGKDTADIPYYFIKTVVDPKDTVRDEENIFVRYVGRYLDGKVFDSNVVDTAKKYGFYTGSDMDYQAQIFTYSKDERQSVEGNDFVKGFSKTVWRLKKGERAYTFFGSGLGYGIDGKGSIPGYMPLCFEIWVEKDNDK